MSRLIYVIKYKFVLATSGDVCWGTRGEIHGWKWNKINIAGKMLLSTKRERSLSTVVNQPVLSRQIIWIQRSYSQNQEDTCFLSEHNILFRKRKTRLCKRKKLYYFVFCPATLFTNCSLMQTSDEGWYPHLSYVTRRIGNLHASNNRLLT
jgi:hypothetical protein